MRRWKQRLAALLSAVLLISALPVTALAEEIEEAAVSDEVVFNLGTMDVTVGTDEEKFEEEEVPYDLFDEDGDYTIALGPDAFFPYEVQFTYDGDTWTEWFMDEDDTVRVGGHTFSVSTYVADPAALTSLSFEIGGRTVTAWPAEKEFTNDGPDVALMSLLPLEERELTVDLIGLTPPELAMPLSVSGVFSGETLDGKEPVLWRKLYEDDDFSSLEGEETFYLKPQAWDSSIETEFIVGTANQLDIENIRYIVTFEITPFENWLIPELYYQKADGTRIQIPAESYLYAHDDGFYDDSENENHIIKLTGTLEVFPESMPEFDKGETPFAGWFMGWSFDQTGDYANPNYDTVQILRFNGLDWTDDVSNQILNQTMSEEDAGFAFGLYNNVYFQVVLLKDGEKIGAMEIGLSCVSPDEWWTEGLYTIDDNGYTRSVSYYTADGMPSDDTEEEIFSLYTEYPVDKQYLFRCGSLKGDVPNTILKVAAITGVGLDEEFIVDDNQDAITSAPDVKEQIFDDGYLADYSGGGVIFVFVEDETLLTDGQSGVYISYTPIRVRTVEGTRSKYTGSAYVTFNGIDGLTSAQVYAVPDEHDSYVENGFQTLMTTEDIDLTDVKLTFSTRSDVRVYDAHNVLQVSGVTANDFSDGPVQFTAVSNDGVTLKNYWVSVVKKQDGEGVLFINGTNDPNNPPSLSADGYPVYERRVLLDGYSGYSHDIFVANVGSENLFLSTEGPGNNGLTRDSYWKLSGELAAFTTADVDEENTPHGELPSVAKIRLNKQTNYEGLLDDTIWIYNDGTVLAAIHITGVAGDPAIITSDLPDAVQYVPYGAVIQNSNMYDWNRTTYSLTSGSLPAGMTLRSNGELYGTPTETGTFTFTVKLQNSYEEFPDVSQNFTLTVLDNTDRNVESSTDKGYELLDRVPATLTEYTDQVFRSQGDYSEFIDFWLDGQKLTDGTDYISEEGSTKITIRAQTFQNAGSGTHTIAAEFRVDGDVNKELKRAAQNYTMDRGSSGGSSGGSSSGGTSTPSIQKPTTPTTPVSPKTTADIFRDITAQDWYYADVDWAYQNKLMIGVTSDLYAPYGLISPATVVTVLARMDKVDLSQYDGVSYPEIAGGQWYTNAAVWAKVTGLLPEGEFSAVPPIARAKFAVMLVKYLESKGIDCTLPEEPVAFADADLMTQEENDAFQVLYQFGIFKGIGGYYMDPQGSTTRAQLAVLLHRLSVFVESHS